MQNSMSININLILFKSVLGIVLAIDSGYYTLILQLISWLQSGHHEVSFFSPLVAVTVSVKPLRDMHQTLLSLFFREKQDSVTWLSWSLTVWACFFFFFFSSINRRQGRNTEGPLYMGGTWKILLSFKGGVSKKQLDSNESLKNWKAKNNNEVAFDYNLNDKTNTQESKLTRTIHE